MKQIDVRIHAVEGVPLLMNTWYGIDPLNEQVKALKKMTTIPSKARTEDWYEKETRLSWMLSLYHDPQIGPFIPAENIEGAIVGGAKKARLGRQFKASMMVEPNRVPLEYDGPRDVEKLYASKAFVDRRPTEAGKMKARPLFRDWALTFRILFDEVILDVESIEAAINAAGIWGIGSYRPKFGKFDVVDFKAK